MPHLRDDGALHAAVVQGLPVDGAEEGVGFDALGAAGEVAEPLGRVHGAEAGDEGAGFGAHAVRVADFAFDDPGGRGRSVCSFFFFLLVSCVGEGED